MEGKRNKESLDCHLEMKWSPCSEQFLIVRNEHVKGIQI